MSAARTHGAVAIRRLGKGYTDDGKAGEVVSFDLKTFKVNSRIKAKDDADGITVDPKRPCFCRRWRFRRF